MIVYTPLWETLKKKGLSTYTLRVKFQIVVVLYSAYGGTCPFLQTRWMIYAIYWIVLCRKLRHTFQMKNSRGKLQKTMLDCK